MLQGTVKNFVFKTSTQDFLSLRFYSLSHTISLYCYYFAIIPISLHLRPLFWSMWKPFTSVGFVHSWPCTKYIVYKIFYYMIFSPIVCYSSTLEVKQLRCLPKFLNFEAWEYYEWRLVVGFCRIWAERLGWKGRQCPCEECISHSVIFDPRWSKMWLHLQCKHWSVPTPLSVPEDKDSGLSIIIILPLALKQHVWIGNCISLSLSLSLSVHCWFRDRSPGLSWKYLLSFFQWSF